MMELKQWMEIAQYRITDGSTYGWRCFGTNAYRLDSWDGDNDAGYSLEVVFDTVTQTVYQVEVHDYKNSRAYQYTNPDFAAAYAAEERAMGQLSADDYKITTLEVEDDWVEKATAIVNYQDYDTDIIVPLDFTDEELLPIFKLAHEAGLTFNEYVCRALRAQLEHIKNASALTAGNKLQ